ncbi:MAG: reductive dehalogenase [Desulfobacterales bacterium]|nr:reductive dehalogenase [Desulfobacterales bacterium]
MMDGLSIILLLIADLILAGSGFYFWMVSIKEKERRAPKVSAAIFLIAVFWAVLIILVPLLRIPIAIILVVAAIFGIMVFIPGKIDPRTSEGADRYIAGNAVRPDERDIVFARFRSLPKGSDVYRQYYAAHPDREERDALRRSMGFLGNPAPGRIDGFYRPNVAMVKMALKMPHYLGPNAMITPDSDTPPADLRPDKAAEIIKNLTLHVGADLVGICKVNQNWAYSHRGEIHYDNWDDWGKPIENLPPYAVVFLTEMDQIHVGSAPHTPTVTESIHLYARGAYISTLLANWFAQMGYTGIAQNTRRYDLVLPPLAVDAGLGEVGRHGYLIAPKFGARVRIFAVLTDMPLEVDKPLSLGVDAFCQRCRKCAESCPSKSIRHNAKIVFNGAEKWKINAETCFEYWAKVGTDCCICMAVCPFSRPNTPLHQFIRRIVARSPIAQRVFPQMDNFIYGKRWFPKPVPEWLNYPKQKRKDKEVY